MTTLLALWSGPRNISTAMMRSWDARPDTVVCDEPLYAHYLSRTGLDHPGAREIIAKGPTDLDSVIDTLTNPPVGRSTIFYQKHMAHHLFTDTDTDTSWIGAMRNGFLIREPAPMLASLLKVLPNADIEATGLPRQVELFRAESERLGEAPPVVNSRDVLEDPEGTLRELCVGFGVPFLRDMLSWEPGPRPSDGVWAPHWYATVEASTGFAPYEPKAVDLPARFTPLLRECERLYRVLAAHALTAEP